MYGRTVSVYKAAFSVKSVITLASFLAAIMSCTSSRNSLIYLEIFLMVLICFSDDGFLCLIAPINLTEEELKSDNPEE